MKSDRRSRWWDAQLGADARAVVDETVEDGWTQARVEELPAVMTAAPTLDEAKESILDALREFLLSFGEVAVAV
jgi:hypothetical protein